MLALDLPHTCPEAACGLVRGKEERLHCEVAQAISWTWRRLIQSPGWTLSVPPTCPGHVPEAPSQAIGPRDLETPSSPFFPESVLSLVGYSVEIELPLEEIPSCLQHGLHFGVLNDGYADRQIMWATVRAHTYMLCKASMLSTDSSRFFTNVKSTTYFSLPQVQRSYLLG